MKKSLKPIFTSLAILVSGFVIGALTEHELLKRSLPDSSNETPLQTPDLQALDPKHLSAKEMALLFYGMKKSIQYYAPPTDPNTTRVVISIENKTCWVDLVKSDPLIHSPFKYLVSSSNC